LNGDDGDEISPMRMDLGRKSDEAMRCALYGQQFQGINKSVMCGIQGNKEESTQAKIHIYHDRPVAVAGGPAANTIPDDVSLYDR
jgi:hypothetical protein